MYTPNELQKMVFFDLETTSTYATLDELNAVNPKMADLWSRRCEYLRSRYEENRELTDEQLYEAKAALHPEFGRIVCATFGRVSFVDDGLGNSMPTLLIKSYASTDESEVIAGIQKVFTNFASMRFVGHYIKRFDVPFLCKRTLMSGEPLPKGLMIHHLKPWEIPFIDTSELWSFGTWQESFTSLELLSTSLGLPTPKSDIGGHEVGRVFWKENNLPRIVEYCQRDVMAVTQIMLKLSGLPIVEDYQLQTI